MTIPSLPDEVILQILEAGYFNHKFRPDRYLLNSCCQVCRAWAAQAQPLLFRHVEVRRPSSLVGLEEALTHSNPRRRALKEVVLWLRVWIGLSDSVTSPAALSFLLMTCSNLYGLSVTFRDMWTAPKERLILPPNVVVLECCNWERGLGIIVTRDLILSAWHSLRILSLRGHLHLDGISPNLSELRIEGPTPSYFTGSALTVKRLQYNWHTSERTYYIVFLRLLEFCQHSLESIHMPWCLSPMSLKSCIRLREFKVETLIHRELFLVLQDLPLEHLAFSVLPTWSTEDFSLECIVYTPTLRVVSCLIPTRPWDQGMATYMDDLEHVCDKKNVRLDYYTTLVSFRAFTVWRENRLVPICTNVVYFREDHHLFQPTPFRADS